MRQLYFIVLFLSLTDQAVSQILQHFSFALSCIIGTRIGSHTFGILRVRKFWRVGI